MSIDVYFLNDFQKSTIENNFKVLKIYFEDDEECTCVVIEHPNLPDGGGIVATSASWTCVNPYQELQYQINQFTKHSVEEIIDRIEYCVENWSLYE